MASVTPATMVKEYIPKNLAQGFRGTAENVAMSAAEQLRSG